MQLWVLQDTATPRQDVRVSQSGRI